MLCRGGGLFSSAFLEGFLMYGYEYHPAFREVGKAFISLQWNLSITDMCYHTSL